MAHFSFCVTVQGRPERRYATALGGLLCCVALGAFAAPIVARSAPVARAATVVEPPAVTTPASEAAPTTVTGAATDLEADAPFDVWEYRVLGNSVLPAVDVERAVYPHLGPGRTMADVEAARLALEQRYRDAGYATAFVDVPPQEVVDGLVRLQVREGRIGQVRLVGGRYFSRGQIRSALPAVQPGVVPNFQDLQSQLAAVNSRTADRRVTPLLRQGREPGAVDVELRVEDRLPLRATLELNDRYTADTSELRASATLAYDNLFGRLDSFSLQYQTAPERRTEVDVLAATYVTRPFADSPATLALYAVDSQSDVAALGTLNVLGVGRVYGARLILPFAASDAAFNHGWTWGLDYKDFVEDVRTELAPDGLQTPIRYLHWSGQYAASWRGEAAEFSTYAGLGLGVRGLGNSTAEFRNKRSGGEANYVHLRVGADYVRTLWAGIRLAGRVNAQYAPTPLVSNEQFAIGGADTVRGYTEAEYLGDYGFAATLELRSPRFGRPDSALPGTAHAFGFVDAGVVSLLEPLGQPPRSDLSSVGVGVRYTGLNGLEAAVDYAWPWVATPRVDDGDGRVHFQVRYAF